jgi:calcium load-activated calcium channel
MMFNSMKCNVIIGIMMIAALNMVGTYFQGIVVVRLPFEPFSIVQGITHRNIEGTDYK